ncbi:hypothetical protein MBLNU13_g11145t2 [Cladosporium sp. NU13]
MFCLRSWVPLLIFLTNASPIYVLLFLTGTYWLQRPCVYCSILLFVLVFSLFDFNADWFAPRWPSGAIVPSETASSYFSGNATLTETLMETAGMAITAINGTGGALASVAMDGVKQRMGYGAVNATASGSGFELVRGLLEKKQIRIPCVDVVVRL